MATTEFPTHVKDDLIKAVTFEDLIIVVQSNEQVVNRETIGKVFRELMHSTITDAYVELRDKMSWIIEQAK